MRSYLLFLFLFAVLSAMILPVYGQESKITIEGVLDPKPGQRYMYSIYFEGEIYNNGIFETSQYAKGDEPLGWMKHSLGQDQHYTYDTIFENDLDTDIPYIIHVKNGKTEGILELFPPIMESATIATPKNNDDYSSVTSSELPSGISFENNDIQSKNDDDFEWMIGLIVGLIVGVIVFTIVFVKLYFFKNNPPKSIDEPLEPISPEPIPSEPEKIDKFEIRLDNSKKELSDVELSWESPNDNHSKIIQYLIQFKTKDELLWHEKISKNLTLTLELKKGFKYQFKIASKNEIGQSDFSLIQEKFLTSSLLDKYQQEAVSFPKDKTLLVAAGPGSGKTRVVAERVKDLILNQNVGSDEILCMTFSKAGESSMKKRLESDLDFKQNKSYFDTKNVRTTHSFCYTYLKSPPGSIFSIKTTNDNDGSETLSGDGQTWKDHFIKHSEEFEFQKLSNNGESFEQLIDAVSAFKRENKTIEDLEKYLSEKASDDEFTIKLQDLLNYWKLYEKYLLTIDKKDFDDLLKQTNEQFNENDFKKEFGAIKYLIIDEFQDTNYLQFEIIKKILPSKNITVVGDKNQSIYSFQGASTELYTDFAKNFKNYSTKQLMYNYRSSPQIVKTSNNFIQTFLEDHSTTVGGYKTQNSSLSPVHVREFPSNGLELEYIFKLIMSNINNEIPRMNAENKIVTFSDFVILTRTNEVRLELRRRLIRLGIPCESKRFTTIEYKEKLITKSLTKILDQNNLNRNSSISELIDSLKKDKNLKYGNLQLNFEESWSEIDESHIRKTISSLANEFHNVLGDRNISEFLLYLSNPNGKSGERRPENWSSISNAVKIQTIHSVKGEEFPYVIIANLIEDHFPIDYFESELKVPVKLKESYSEEHSEKLHMSEESRLFYVALSRPKNELFLTYSSKNNSEESTPSRFLYFLNYLSSQENLEFKKIDRDAHIPNYISSKGSKSKNKSTVETIETVGNTETIDSQTVGMHFFDEFLRPKNTICICSPWISKEYAEIFVNLSKKNKKIKIITHNDVKNKNQLETIRILKENKNENLDFRITNEMIHTKLFIKDKTLAVEGSVNFTFTGLFNQKNRVTIHKDKKIEKICTSFDEYWKNSKNS